jgi:hypothetical protein
MEETLRACPIRVIGLSVVFSLGKINIEIAIAKALSSPYNSNQRGYARAVMAVKTNSVFSLCLPLIPE